ncbi:PTS sugar transporter subunit IIA [Paraburkholderia solisilvae]|uniref:PTS EIIA type-2 domain-containing protein n=1 Tax=Paraburkholderia solisilvae TaxID=624376 RepID=A0A6J5DDR4_9BURK|nr:PTS sugar transporter subunit IIA [Paraburkholderia solisilvae]CAB3751567.1 hypothetical protein LMG29739_01322 [Paraburkholderia solisilvae]
MAHPLAGLQAWLKRGKSEARAQHRAQSRHEPGRNVMLHVTVDAQHTTPFREALIRDCGNQQWTLRVAPLRDSARVQLSLYLPKADVGHAMQRLSQLTPDAEVGQVVEIPDTPSHAWRSLIHADANGQANGQADAPGRPATRRHDANGKRRNGSGRGAAQGASPGASHGAHRTIDNHADATALKASTVNTPRDEAMDVADVAAESIIPVQPGLAQLLPASHVLLALSVADREQLFAQLSQAFETLCGVPAEIVTAGLASREALGSTGLGRGVAVPHGHIADLAQPVALYARLAEPIAFDAPDGQPVSDIVALLVPQWADSAHLHLLAEVAQCFCDHQFRDRLHACADAGAVCRLFNGRDTLEQAERGARRIT